MATCRDIVNRALRKIGRLGSGRDARQVDALDTLEALKGMYPAWIASGAFGRIEDVIPTGEYYTAEPNQRIFRNQSATMTVTIPEVVSNAIITDYGRRVYGNYGTNITISTVNGDTVIDVKPGQPIGFDVAPPRDGSVIIISDAFTAQTITYLYDGTVKLWQSIDALTLDDDAPRSSADPEGLAAMLAIEVSDQFGADVPAATQRAAVRFQTAMTARFGMDRTLVPGVYF